MNFRVRRMEEADLEAVAELAEGLPTAPRWSRETYLAAIDLASQPLRNAQVAVAADGELLGFAVASLVPPEAELESIVVAPGFQRRGIARGLFEVLVGELVSAGVAEILLEVRASNAAALAAYRALGFKETGRRPGYYANPVEDAVLLGRRI
ncbi:MAG TPA: ribosomal protein S18-alanine N-acetyltransferase [Terracidiphilus sp.]|jgi:[ribosomal protein S18]-alanine N-acetyltransferase